MSDRSKYDDDDGRVIASMDVDGMPWHDRRVRKEQSAALKEAARLQRKQPGERMTDSETRRYIAYSLLAGLVIAAVFSVTIVLFVLFAQFIWLR